MRRRNNRCYGYVVTRQRYHSAEAPDFPVAVEIAFSNDHHEPSDHCGPGALTQRYEGETYHRYPKDAVAAAREVWRRWIQEDPSVLEWVEGHTEPCISVVTGGGMFAPTFMDAASLDKWAADRYNGLPEAECMSEEEHRALHEMIHAPSLQLGDLRIEVAIDEYPVNEDLDLDLTEFVAEMIDSYELGHLEGSSRDEAEKDIYASLERAGAVMLQMRLEAVAFEGILLYRDVAAYKGRMAVELQKMYRELAAARPRVHRATYAGTWSDDD